MFRNFVTMFEKFVAMFGNFVAMFEKFVAMFGNFVAMFGNFVAMFRKFVAMFGNFVTMFACLKKIWVCSINCVRLLNGPRIVRKMGREGRQTKKVSPV